MVDIKWIIFVAKLKTFIELCKFLRKISLFSLLFAKICVILQSFKARYKGD